MALTNYYVYVHMYMFLERFPHTDLNLVVFILSLNIFLWSFFYLIGLKIVERQNKTYVYVLVCTIERRLNNRYSAESSEFDIGN